MGTCFPQPIALASTFDDVLVEQVADCIGKECRAVGVRQVLAPVVNVCRDSRWGALWKLSGKTYYGVEHLRRNRGRCMGALYWQLNDCWPVASWASIDGYGRYKALHYEAKRFFEPIHISCEETGEYSTRKDITDERYYGYETKAKLFVNNDTLQDVEGVVEWQLCACDGAVLQKGSEKLSVKALSYASLEEMDFHKTDVRNNYLAYSFKVGGEVVSFGTVLFTKPKHFNFIDPKVKVDVCDGYLLVKADAYAKYVYISNENDDLILSDNFFDMEKGVKRVEIISGNPTNITVKTVFDIQ